MMPKEKAKTAAVVETKWWGHHPSYMKMIVRTFVELGAEVLCLCPAPDEMEDWALRDPTLRGKVFCAKLPDHDRLVRLEIEMRKRRFFGVNLIRWIAVRIALERLRLKMGRRSRMDIVFINMLDEYLFTSCLDGRLDLVMPYPWAGVVLFPKLHETACDLREEPPKRIGTALCKGIFVLQETALSPMSRAVGMKCEAFPDFTDTSGAPVDSLTAIVREIKAAAHGRKIIGLYGVLDKRKGILLLLKCAAQMKDEQILFAVVGDGAAGRVDSELLFFENKIRTDAYPNIFFFRGKIPTEADFNALVEASFAIWIVYPNWPYSSNILTKAAYLKRPVFVAEGGLLAERVSRFGLGVAVDADDVDATARGIRAVCFENAVSPDSAGFADYYKMHSEDRLRDILSGLLKAKDTPASGEKGSSKSILCRLGVQIRKRLRKIRQGSG